MEWKKADLRGNIHIVVTKCNEIVAFKFCLLEQFFFSKENSTLNFAFQIAAWKIILYAVITPFFVMGLIVYYYAIFDHYL